MTRREWCTKLAMLVSPSFPVEATEALHRMLPAMQHLPDGLFNERSLMRVASVKRRQSVPAWDELIGALDEYRRTFLPDPTLRLASRPNADLPAGRLPPGPEEVAIVTEMLTSWRAEQIAREAERPKGQESRPLRDVTLKGRALAASRRARGCPVPVPGYEREDAVEAEFVEVARV